MKKLILLLSIFCACMGAMAQTSIVTVKNNKMDYITTPGDSTKVLCGDDQWRSVTAPYKVYTALFTQYGESAPVATVLENTLGTVTWNYADVGVYTITSSALFTENKTIIFYKDGADVTITGNWRTMVYWNNSSTIYLQTYDSFNDMTDNGYISSGCPASIEIRVYP